MGTSRSRVEDPEGEIRKAFREAGYADGWTNAVIKDFKAEQTSHLGERLNWLAALEAAGVDNWEGCDIAYRIMEGEEGPW